MGEEYRIKPIGVVEKAGDLSVIHVYSEFHQGLTAIGDYERLMVLFWMHLRDNEEDRSKLMSSRPRHGKEGFRGVCP